MKEHLLRKEQDENLHWIRSGRIWIEGKFKDALAVSIDHVFLIGSILMGVTFIATFFIKEIPLKKGPTHKSTLEESGEILAVEEGQFDAEDEPEL